MPLQIAAGYFRFGMQRKLSAALRKAYAASADIACEQVAAIRTVASLNREPFILDQFERSLKQPVHDAMIKTLKSTGVPSLMTVMLMELAVRFCPLLHVPLDGSLILVWEYLVSGRRIFHHGLFCSV